jgi:8-oxo-dGTP pyrophosphatase MutT (NUDIX family)
MKPTIKQVGTNVVYETPWLRLRDDAVLQHGKKSHYGVIERADSVVVIPQTPSGSTILLHQFRYPSQSYSWEFPMGAINDGETPEAAARRELLEETGLSPRKLHKVGQFLPVPGLMAQINTVFVAQVDETDLQSAQVPEGVDDIVGWKVVSAAELDKMLKQGKITDAFSLASLTVARSTSGT